MVCLEGMGKTQKAGERKRGPASDSAFWALQSALVYYAEHGAVLRRILFLRSVECFINLRATLSHLAFPW